MILLRSVTKTYFPKDEAPKPVLRPTTIGLPTDRRVAILGDRLKGKSVLLRLIARQEAPDTGSVFVPQRLSPIANAGALFHPRLSALENVRVVARMLGVQGDGLAAAVDAFCGLGLAMEKPVRLLGLPERQRLDITLVALLSFDCYLLDNAHRVPAELLEGFLYAAGARGAGSIFTTTIPRQVYEYADHAVVIEDHGVREFDEVEEAVWSYERRAG